MNPHSNPHFIFDKGAKKIQWRKDRFFNKCCWEKWLSFFLCFGFWWDLGLLSGKVVIYLQKPESRSMPVTLYYCQHNVIKDLSIRPETLQLVHKRAGNTLEAIGIGKEFLS
jgi:hypothetical protein